VAPSDLGFTLPHEHTKCSLWWIENRWDYWELIGDEPRINEELAAYKALGGGTLVDVTPIGIGRDLARLARFLVEHRRELEFLTWSLAIGVLLVLSLAADSGGR
jgi:predicted metal-dependent phosphotriesterase family hydrolase